MNRKILKKEVVKRVVERLKGTKIEVGGNKQSYKRKYHLKYSQKIVDNVISSFLDELVDIIAEGDSVKFERYMVIEPRYYVAKRARNLHDDTEYMMPAQYRARLRAGSKLEEACKQLSRRELNNKDKQED